METKLDLSDEFTYESYAKNVRFNFTLLFSTLALIATLHKISETNIQITRYIIASGLFFFAATIFTFLMHLKIVERISEKSPLKTKDIKQYLIIFWSTYMLGLISIIIHFTVVAQ